MKGIRKVIASAITSCMVMSVFGGNLLLADVGSDHLQTSGVIYGDITYVATDTDDDNCYDLLEISGTGDMPDLQCHYNENLESTYIDFKWDSQIYLMVKRIVINEGITSIGNHNFEGFVNVTEVELPHSLHSMRRHAFNNMQHLEQITVYDNDFYFYGDESIVNYRQDCTILIPCDYDIRSCSRGWDLYGDAAGNCDHISYCHEFSADDGTCSKCGAVQEHLSIGRTLEDGTSLVFVDYDDDEIMDTLYVSGDGPIKFYSDYYSENYDVLCWIRRYSSGVKEVYVNEGITEIANDFFKEYRSVEYFSLPSSLTKIGSHAFESCGSLKKIDIPDGVKEIGSCAFLYCGSLTEVNFPESIDILDMTPFGYCNSLKVLTLPNIEQYYGGNLSYFNGLKKVCIRCDNPLFDSITGGSSSDFFYVIHDYDDENVDYYCNRCGEERDITVKTGKLSNSVFYTRYDLDEDGAYEHLVISGFGDIPDSNLLYAFITTLFGNDTKKIVIEDGITGIGDYSFYNFKKLSKVELPESVTRIGDHAFENCSLLRRFDIPETVVSIGDEAFSSSGLTSIRIHSKISELGENVFDNCSSLNEISVFCTTYYTNHTFIGENEAEVKVFHEGEGSPYYEKCYLDDSYNLNYGYYEGSKRSPVIREYFEPYDYDNSGYLEYGELEDINTVCFRDVQLGDDVNVTLFSNLQYLYLENTHVYNVNVDRNHYLKVLSMPGNNDVMTLKLYNNPYLEYLDISNTNIREIDISSNPHMIYAYQNSAPIREQYSDGSYSGVVKYSIDGYTLRIDQSTAVSVDGTHTHNYITTGEKAATCTEPGSTGYTYCDICYTYFTNSKVIPATGHTIVNIEAIAPTCTTSGRTAGSYCAVCDEVIKQSKPLGALGHTTVIDKAIPATCTTNGLTEGSHCSRCNKIIKSQQSIDALGHHVVNDPAVTATCEHYGLTKGSHCDRCNAVIVAQQVIEKEEHDVEIIPKVNATCTEPGLSAGAVCIVCGTVTKPQVETAPLGHREVFVNAVPATCTEAGQTGGSYCSRCRVDLSSNEVIPALGHDVVVDEGHEPTCTSTGLTEGSHCTRCDAVTVVQEVIPATGHTLKTIDGKDPTCTTPGYSSSAICEKCSTVVYPAVEYEAWGHSEVIVEGYAPTCTEDGLTSETYCRLCGNVFVHPEIIPALGHDMIIDNGKEPTCTEDGFTAGTHCSRCDYTEGDSRVIPALGHDVVADEGFAATCTTDGLTNGSHCTRCDEVTVAQEVIPATGHTPVTDAGYNESCLKDGLSYGSHCATCGTILESQVVIPAPGHNPVTVLEVPPTCTLEGYTEAVMCSRCHKYIVPQDIIPPTGHNIVITPQVDPTPDHDGWSEIKSCSTCGEVIDSGHVLHYEVSKKVSLVGHSITLDGSIGINFYISMSSDITTDPSAYVMFDMNNGTTTNMPISSARYDETKGAYVFTCKLAAKQMTDVVSAQVVVPGDEEWRSDAYSYSVAQYASELNTIAPTNPNYARALNLVNAMLTYGSYAQEYFEYNLDNIALDRGNRKDVSISVDDLSAYAEYGLFQGNRITFVGGNLSLLSETTVKMYFNVPEEIDISRVEFALDGRTLTPKKSGDYYYVEITNVAAKDLDTIYSVQVLIDGAVDSTCSYSAMTYCYNTLISGDYDVATTKLKSLVSALYVYNQAANEYFN